MVNLREESESEGHRFDRSAKRLRSRDSLFILRVGTPPRELLAANLQQARAPKT
jgi:hypothetical protein